MTQRYQAYRTAKDRKRHRLPAAAAAPGRSRARRWRAAHLVLLAATLGLLCLAVRPAAANLTSLSVTETVSGNTVPLDPAFATDRVDFEAIIEPGVDDVSIFTSTAAGYRVRDITDGNGNALTDADTVAAGFQIESLAYGRNTVKFRTDHHSNVQPDRDYTLTIWRARTPLFCKRTSQVRDIIVGAVSGVEHCANVTASHLSQITELEIAPHPTAGLLDDYITALRAGDFAGLTGLRVLKLVSNRFTSLPADLFDGLTALRELRISNSTAYTLTLPVAYTLPAGLFDELSALQILELENFNNATLPPALFDKLVNLTHLHLDGYSAGSNTLSAGLFDRLTSSLEILGLRNFERLPVGLFNGLGSLDELFLCTNSAHPGAPLTRGLFNPLTGLRVLEICGFRALLSLPSGLFDRLTGLERLFVYRSGFDSLPAGLFDRLTGLKELLLFSNRLHALPDNLFEKLTAIATIDLGWNPGTATFLPKAEAGLDRSVPAGAQVTLRGATSGPWGSNVTVAWTQTGGPSVTLSNADTLSPSFTAPDDDAFNADLQFTLTVTAVNCGPGDADAIYGCFSGEPATVAATDTVAVSKNDLPTLAFRGATVADGVPEDSVGFLEFSEGVGTVVLTAFLDAAQTEALTVPWFTTDETAVSPDDFAAGEGTLTFAAGETEKTISVRIVDDAVAEEPRFPGFESGEWFTVSLVLDRKRVREIHGGAVNVVILDNDGGASNPSNANTGGGNDDDTPGVPDTTPGPGGNDDDDSGGGGGGGTGGDDNDDGTGGPSNTGDDDRNDDDPGGNGGGDPGNNGDDDDSGGGGNGGNGDDDGSGGPGGNDDDDDPGGTGGGDDNDDDPGGNGGNGDNDDPGNNGGTGGSDDDDNDPGGTGGGDDNDDDPGNNGGTGGGDDDDNDPGGNGGGSGNGDDGSSGGNDGSDDNSGGGSDDDEPPTALTLRLDPATVSEGDGPTEITVTATFTDGTRAAATPLAIALAAPEGVAAAVAGTDFVAVPAFILSIPPGQSAGSATFTFEPLHDTVHEGDETLIARATTSLELDTGAPPTLTLEDDDAPPTALSLSLEPATVSEGDGPTEITVTATFTDGMRAAATPLAIALSAPGGDAAAAVAGEDFAAVPGFTLTIPPGQSAGSATFTFEPLHDTVHEGDETLIARATTELPLDTGEPPTLTLEDDDTPPSALSLRLDPATVSEGAGPVEITVTATFTDGMRAAATPLAIALAAPEGVAAAVAGEDFVAVPDFTLTIPPAQSAGSATFTFEPLQDTVHEGDETLLVRATTSLELDTGEPPTLTLEDDDAPPSALTLRLDPATVSEGAGPTEVTVTATFADGARAEATELTVSVAGAGFVAVPDFTLTIPPGQSAGSATFTFEPLQDTVHEGDQTLIVRASAANLDLDTGETTTLTLEDDDEPPSALTLRLDPATVSEGAGATEITVTATFTDGMRAAATSLAIALSAPEGTAGAVAGTDFVAVPGFTLTIPPGQSAGSATFTFEPLHDTVHEGDETLIARATTASLELDTGQPPTLTLADDDEPPSALTLRLDPDTVSEGAGPTEITVTATFTDGMRAAATPLAIALSAPEGDAAAAVAGADFAAVPGFTLTIPPAQSAGSATFTFEPLHDTVHEGDETLIVRALSAELPLDTGAPPTLTLEDDDAPPTALTLRLDPATVSEGAGPTEITVTATFTDGMRAAATPLAVSLAAPEGDAAAAVAGEDFAAVPDFTLTIPPAQSAGSATFTFEPLQDTVHEGDETLIARATTSLELDTGQPPTLTLEDDDAPPSALTLRLDPATVSEGDGPTEITVTATFTDGMRATATPLAIALSAPEGAAAAVAGEDFVPVPDFTLSEGAGPTEIGGGTRVPAAAFSIAPGSRDAGTPAAPGADVTALSLTIPPGAVSGAATFTFEPLQDRIHEGPETVVVQAAPLDPGLRLQPQAPPALTLADDDGPPQPVLTVETDAIAEGGGKTTVTVSTGEGSTYPVPTTIELVWSGTASRGEDYELDAVTLTLPAGVGLEPSTVTVTVSAPDDDLDELDETVVLGARLDGRRVGEPVTVTVIDDDTAGIVIDPADLSVEEGDGAAYSVALTSEPFGDVAVTVSGHADTPVGVDPRRLLFDASNWNRPQTVRVSAARDDDPDDSTVTLVHSAAGGGYDDVAAPTLTVRVVDRFVVLPQLSVADASALETDGELAFEFSLDRVAWEDVEVRYATRDGSARAGEDYEAVAGTVVIPLGQTGARVAVPLRADVLPEPEEDFTLELDAVRGAELAAARARGTIRDAADLTSRWLAEFGRLAGDRVMEAVEKQVFAPRGRGSQVTLAGRPIALTGRQPSLAGQRFGGAAGAPAFGASPDERLWAGGADDLYPGATLAGADTLGWMDLLANSAFLVSTGPGGGNGLSAWGQGHYTRFGLSSGGLRTNGDATSLTIGADWACNRCLLGLALSHTRAEADYSIAAEHAGRLKSTLTGLYPYFGFQLTEKVAVWGLAGQGRGELSAAASPDAPVRRVDLEHELAGVGVRGELLSTRSGLALAAKTDALTTTTRSQGGEGFRAAAGDYRRLRLGLEGSWTRSLGADGLLRSSLEVAARNDAGDAHDGLGMEVAGALHVIDVTPGLSLNLGVRGLLSHQAEDAEEWGITGGLRYDPRPESDAGPTVSLNHSWGVSGGRLGDALWHDGTARLLPSAARSRDSRLDAAFAWGFKTFSGTAIPWARVGSAGAGGRDVRLGYTHLTPWGSPILEVGESAFARDARLGWAFTLRCRVHLTVELTHVAERLGGRDDNGLRIGFGSLAPGSCTAPAAAPHLGG